MKKFTLAFISIIAVLTLPSCTDMLELSPTDGVASGNMWTTESLADKGMAGLYRAFYVDDISDLEGPQIGKAQRGFNRFGIEAMGFATDYYAGFYSQKLLSDAAKHASDSQLSLEWGFGYTIIHSCNTAIANLSKAGLSEEKLNRYYCEARFLRAFAYHRLNMLFFGVPLYLEPVENDECTKGQATENEIWNAVLDDLKFCIDNIYFPDNTITDDGSFGRPSKGAAYALRGMVYMWLARGDEHGNPPANADEYYEMAAEDFAKTADCGYGLWQGEYIDFFKPENEKDKEMIFAIQFDEASGYSDNIQNVTGAWDTYSGWGHIKPSADFVDYYQNADGSEFKWNEVKGLEEWDQLTVQQREVFFLRDGMESLGSFKAEAIKRIGEDIYRKYYLNSGNEDRISKAYQNRDPRLRQTVLPPYEPQDCYVPGITIDGQADAVVKNKELRNPFIRSDANGGDIRLNDPSIQGIYMYRKYVEFDKGRLMSSGGRRRCFTDWPLIRYTDVLLQRAEALAHISRLSEAKILVNKIRNRAHMPDITASTVEEMLEAIRYERRVELCLEGINYFDEIRWGTFKKMKFQGQNRYGGQAWWGFNEEMPNQYLWYYDDCLWPWSAPLSEIQKNSNLKRRNGWAY